jgi:hypothetical protein
MKPLANRAPTVVSGLKYGSHDAHQLLKLEREQATDSRKTRISPRSAAQIRNNVVRIDPLLMLLLVPHAQQRCSDRKPEQCGHDWVDVRSLLHRACRNFPRTEPKQERTPRIQHWLIKRCRQSRKDHFTVDVARWLIETRTFIPAATRMHRRILVR